MDKRKEMKEAFNPEKIDYVAVIKSLNWDKEITPVDLVKAVNYVEGLKGRKKYETNEKSFGLLIKCFEKRVGDLVTTRINGKDRFYMLKPEYKPEQIVHYAKTGEILEIKEELKKEDPKFYISTTSDTKEEEEKKRTTRKRCVFPDCEAIAKSAILLYLLKKGEGKVDSKIFNEIREKFGWKYQRSIEGKPYTSYMEVNRFCTDYLDDLGKNPISIGANKKYYKFEGDPKILDNKIKDTLTLIEDEDLKKKVQEFITEPEAKEKTEPIPKLKEVIEDKPMPTPKHLEPKPIITERPRIIKATPVIGNSEFRETGPAPSTIYESSKVKWYKSLIAATLKGAERGVWYNFSDISSIIKKTRYVEIGLREIKDLLIDIGKQYKGIFREIDFGGITIGSEVLVKDFGQTYSGDKVVESIFIRLHMTIEELIETYPELKFKIASKISEGDNVYEIETNRSEKTEKAFAKLVFRMRQGETILESPNNWTIKRTKILIDKLFGGI